MEAFLTKKEIEAYSNRPCNACEELEEDQVAPFGYCKKLQRNDTGFKIMSMDEFEEEFLKKKKD